MTGRASKRSTETLRDVVEDMERRLAELQALRASPDMYGSEMLDGQVVELELWLDRFGRVEPE